MMKYIDRMIAWFYSFITIRFGVTKHHDKWLHAALIFGWVVITSVPFTLTWSILTAQIWIFGREGYNVYQRYLDGYDLSSAYRNGWSWKDIIAGELGGLAGLFVSLVFLGIINLFGGL